MKAKPTLATAIQIGNPVSINKAIRALKQFDGIVEQASETELAEAAARADRTGMFNCPHTAVALAALEKIVARGEIKRSDRVIVISTANGLKFSEFKTAYHTGSLPGVTPRHANPPVELPNDYDAVRRAIDRRRGIGLSFIRNQVTVAITAEAPARSLEVRRGVARRRRRDRAGRRPDPPAQRSARDRRVRARRRHRPAARRRGGGHVGTHAPTRLVPRRRSCAGTATSRARSSPPGRHDDGCWRRLTKRGARVPRTVRRDRRARPPRAARERSAGVARRADGGADCRRGAQPGAPASRLCRRR